MHCASCVSAIEGALKKVEGVNQARVNLATEQAFVRYNPGKTDVGQIRKAIDNAGYRTIAGSKEGGQEEEKKLRFTRDTGAEDPLLDLFYPVPCPLFISPLAPRFDLSLPGFVKEHSWLVSAVTGHADNILRFGILQSGDTGIDLWTKKANMNTLV